MTGNLIRCIFKPCNFGFYIFNMVFIDIADTFIDVLFYRQLGLCKIEVGVSLLFFFKSDEVRIYIVESATGG